MFVSLNALRSLIEAQREQEQVSVLVYFPASQIFHDSIELNNKHGSLRVGEHVVYRLNHSSTGSYSKMGSIGVYV